jgi:hypothetical protein
VKLSSPREHLGLHHAPDRLGLNVDRA